VLRRILWPKRGRSWRLEKTA